MKKALVTMMLLAVCVLALTGCGKKKEKLKLFLPGEYLGEDVISDFEKEFNCEVIVENFDSNEAMYTKLQAGDKYDVLIPSDYTIERLMKEDYLQKLDKDAITNIGNLADEVKNLSFDPNNDYSIPYFWGTVGIVYNKDNVDIADLENEGFGIFKDAKYKGRVYMYDSARDGFMIALKQLGYSCNTENEDEINAAYDWLIEMNKTTQPIYVTDEVIDNMKACRKDLAIVYSGDATDILSETPNMGYFTPSCGTNVWYDSMVIPKNAENPSLANKFINFMLNYDQCLDGSTTVGYASPNKTVLAELSAEDGEFGDNEAYLPHIQEKDEIFHDNEVIRKKLNELWIKVVATQ
ncbi:MAG: ABC transporter substrate-binding protein [Lachnospiraceae bacterium]|nr:ABC transporter substrate-binding protein [Lachnospiraceae bacterium]